MAVNGALLELTKSYNWELFGTATPEEAASLMWDMWQSWHEDKCLIGSIFPYATAVAPSGTLLCDGSTHDRVDYPVLYSLLASEFIVDADTFVTPDLRGRTVIGVGTGTGLTERNVNDIGGEETHVLNVGELASHGHTDAGHAHTEITALPNATTIGPGAPQPTAIPGIALTGTGFASISSTGSGNEHNNMQPFIALKYCMVAL